jgi:hypothetical protein
MHPYLISRKYFLIRDNSRSTPSLDHLFQDSHEMFKLRVRHLGNTTKITTEDESETLRIMLEALISAKKQLQSSQ